MESFSQAKADFDTKFKDRKVLSRSIVTVNGKFIDNISLVDRTNSHNEEYYKWQFIYSLINSGLIGRDYIGCEIYFPKGNKDSTPIKIDAVVFKTTEWVSLYLKYRENKDQVALSELRKLAVMMIEFKRDGNDSKIEQIFNSQIRATINESDAKVTIGVYYDKERLFLFKKESGKIVRLDNSKNFTTSQRILEQYQLEITDPYFLIPSIEQLKKLDENKDQLIIENRLVENLDIIYRMNDESVKNSLNQILKTLDSLSLFNEEGYLILIQMIALKIHDEKESIQYGNSLSFYIIDSEYQFKELSEKSIQKFIERMKQLFNSAQTRYRNLLYENKINWKNSRHIRVVSEIVKHFQNYSFSRSRKSDLYQLVFYNFATKFKKDENAQFLTPLPIIDFIVKLINPKRNETICDPCCGIADFLSVSYVNSDGKLSDNNLYGFDNDYNMTILAQLNMLLNGDGNATIKYMGGKGSIDQKLDCIGEIKKLDESHNSGKWDKWADETRLMKYDVILTNPPFGKGRSLDLSKGADVQVAALYETYDLYIKENPKSGLDLGIVFLENTIRSLKVNGRFAIILSNSIASTKSYEFARKWVLSKIRLVAIIDLPSNIFAETGVNTTIFVGYKPTDSELLKLKESNYRVFCKEIQNVGYEKRTSQRNVYFSKIYKLDEQTFETLIDENGESISDEDFSQTFIDFQEWCLFQEEKIKDLFLGK
ncbi:MAG: N-6 DNA methylase [Sphaerochaeta sp.]|nr:N-6 DNA methylase [Sphaerochaeta sp.]